MKGAFDEGMKKAVLRKIIMLHYVGNDKFLPLISAAQGRAQSRLSSVLVLQKNLKVSSILN